MGNKLTLPHVNPRRPLEPNDADGYRESDRDFFENNREAAIWFLENRDRLADSRVCACIKQVDIGPVMGDGGTFVELGEALETVLELASQNALTVEDEEGSLAEEAMRQQAALETVEDFVVNHFGADEQEPEPK